MTRLLLASIFCFLLFSDEGIAQKTKSSKSEKPAEISWLTHEGENFKVDYPSNWTLDVSGQAGSTFFVLSELSSEEDNFRENINLLIQDLKGQNIDLDQYVSISEGQIKEYLVNGNLISSDRQKGKDGPYHRIVYSGDQADFRLKYEQYYIIKDELAYVLTYTALDGDFAKFQPITDRILSSFRFN